MSIDDIAVSAVWKTRLFIRVFLISIFIVLSYELKSYNFTINIASGKIGNPIPPLVLALLGFVVGSYLSVFFDKYLFKSKRVRMWLFGDSWIEGAWYVKTYDGKKLISRAIVQLSYFGDDFQLKSVAYHLQENGLENLTHSHKVVLFEDGLLYINYISVARGSDQLIGIATGHYYIDSSNKYPNLYDGKIVLFDGSNVNRQFAIKIKNGELKQYVGKCSNWQSQYLNDRKASNE